jgi:thymidine kinase
MRSEKSLEAIRQTKRYQVLYGKESTIFVNPRIDIRTSDGIAKSRGGNEMECIVCDKLSEIEGSDLFQKAKLVTLDEAQFFPDLFNFVMKHCDKKSFIVTSLDGDWKQEQFGQVWSLIPYATMEKLTGFCELCRDGTPSVCTIAVGPMTGQVSVDEAEGTQYLAACLQHRTSEAVKDEFRRRQTE